MTLLEEWINATPERRREYEQERLVVDVAEEVQTLLDKDKVKRAELARRMGVHRTSLQQMLSGQQNLTLRTMAIMAHELGYRVSVTFEPYRAAGETEASPRLWKKQSDGNPYCANCRRTWDMHAVGGMCPDEQPVSETGANHDARE